MAVFLPIVTEFKDTGIKKAIKEFQSLETASQKAGFIMKKAALPAAAAFAGLAAVGGIAVKAAMEDAQAQAQLANQLRNTTGATNAQIAATEDFISQTSMAAAVADDQLRPALANLVRSSGDLQTAQDQLNLALDISAGTGKDLESVSIALGKAQTGNVTALKKLGIPLSENIVKTNDFEAATAELSSTFAGAASTAANSAEGQFKKLGIALDETKESIGEALLPAVSKVLPYLITFGNWAKDNTGILLGVGFAIGAIAAAIIAYNVVTTIATIVTAAFGIALQSTGIPAIVALVVLLALAIVGLYLKFEIVRTVVNAVINFIIGIIENWLNAWIFVINKIIDGINLLIRAANIFGAGLSEIGHIGEVEFGRIATAAENAAQFISDNRDLLTASRNAERQGIVVKRAVTKATEDSAKATGSATKETIKYGEAVKTKVTAALTDAKKKLDDAKNAFTDFSKTVADSLKGGLSASTAFDAGKESGTSFVDALKAQVSGVKQYSSNIQQLLELGLSQESLKFVLAAGAESGASIAQELINGGVDAITTTNALIAAAEDAAAVVGDQAASRWYEAGVTQAQALVDGLTAELEKLTPAVIAAMNKAAGKWGDGVDVEMRADERAAQIIGGASGNIVSSQVERLDNNVLMGLQQRRLSGDQYYTINVQALTPTPEVGRVVVNAVRAMNRSDGPANIATYK